MDANLPIDEHLWLRLIEGDEVAFTQLFQRHYSTLVSYGKSFIKDTDRVQDCIQDVFVDIWLYRCSLNHSVSVKAYLFSSVRKRIARFYTRDHIFRHTTSLNDVEFSITFTVEDRLIANEETAVRIYQLNRQINSLPPRQKEALFLKYHQGLNTEQIAEILNINYQSANNLLHRALVQLRRELKGNVSLLLLLFSELV
jgi:RNA polymerase sigma factor (sigma-70 family)